MSAARLDIANDLLFFAPVVDDVIHDVDERFEWMLAPPSDEHPLTLSVIVLCPCPQGKAFLKEAIPIERHFGRRIPLVQILARSAHSLAMRLTESELIAP